MEITKEWLITNEFKPVTESGPYRFDIDLPYPGKRFIEAALLPHGKWVAYYMVNDIPASKAMYTKLEVIRLGTAITGTWMVYDIDLTKDLR